jgi:hypothetical protein
LLDEPPAAQVAPPSGNIRILAPGDFWSYQSERSGTANGRQFKLEGIFNMRVEPQVVADAVRNLVRVVSASVSFTDRTTGDSISSVAQLYQSQDPSGAMYLHGEVDDTVQPSVTRWVIVPETGRALQTVSPLRIGATLQTNFLEFDDGTTGTMGGVVVGVESVTVPAGTFATYRFEGSCTRVKGGTTTTTVSTAWWVPAIGAAVKFKLATSIRNDTQGMLTSFDETAELVRTTIPLP